MLKLVNPNYCATVVKVEKLVQLENCSNVQAAIIMGNQIIVSKEVKIGDIGLFFPVEVQLSKKYLLENNLYRKKELNSDPEAKSGYFEENGRIRCVKFRGHKSEGLFMPLNSLNFLNLKKSLSTGRSVESSRSTLEWLSKHNINFTEIYFRKKDDYRPDWIVKEEMWRDISKSYNIELIYEDRNQVVRRARALDLKVAQVKYGNY